MTQPALLLSTLNVATPSTTSFFTYNKPAVPIKAQAIVMPIELQSMRLLRPATSANRTAGKVAKKFTKLLMVVKTFLEKPIASKILGPKYMKAFMPTNCCSSCNATPKTRSRKTRPCSSSDQAGSPSRLARSFSVKISNSSCTASFSDRIFSKTFRASLRRPTWTNQRGDRGNAIIPSKSSKAGRQMIAMTILQPSSLSTMTWSM
mmetsp:Transcript_13437/g.29379  ORF Transcript_13437/g.29379 Transcript_13437/m.29379 type:complete len:205 (+) Transcript_13437:451-1065(+)